MQPGILLDQRQQLSFFGTQHINFVQKQECRSLGSLHQIKQKLIRRLSFFGRVNDRQHQVASIQRLPHISHHLPSQRAIGPVHTGRVN